MDETIRGMAVELSMSDASFSAGIKNLKQQLTVIDSEFKASGSGVKDWGNTLDGIQAHTTALGQKISIQKQIIQEYNAQLEKTQATQAKNAERLLDLKSKLDATKTAYEQSVSAVGENDVATKALKDEVDKLAQKYKSAENAIVKNQSSINGYTIQINKATADLKKMETELVQVNNLKLEKLGKQLDDTGNKMANAGKKTMALSAAIVAGGAFAAKAAVDYESAFAGVEKTVDATEKQLSELSTGIRKLALEIPASTTEIASVAEAAGQLGIATEDILDFTDVMIALGESTNLSADEAATALAKFANVTQMASDDYERLGSVIVDLGNKSATTEADIVEMGTKLASTGSLVGLTQSQIMAFAATLSSLGIEAEAGGTAIAKLLKQFEVLTETGSKDLDNFAKVAGQSADEFTASWEKDPAEAVAAFISGLGKLDKAGGSSVATLENLGITEVRMSNAILAMASSGDLLTQSLYTANEAWDENTALQTEAEKRYATTESQLQIAKNTLNEIAITMGSEFLPMVNRAIDGVQDMGEWFAGLNDEQKENIVRILAITAAIGPMVFAAGKAAIGINALITAYGAYKAAALAGEAATKAFMVSLGVTPVGLAMTAIALLGSVIIGNLVSSALSGKDAVDELSESVKKFQDDYNSSVETIKAGAESQRDNIAAIEEMLPRFDELNDKVNRTAAEQTELSSYAEKLNELFGTQVYVVDKVSGSYNSAVGSIDAYINKLLEQINQQAILDEIEAEVSRKRAAQSTYNEAAAQLEAVNQELKDYTSNTTGAAKGGRTYIEHVAELINKQTELKDAVSASSSELDGANSNIESLTNELKEAAGATEDQTGATEDGTDAAEAAIKTTDELTTALDEQSKASETLSSAIDTGSKALQEQADNGKISLSTILDLVDAGYAAALSVDAETGAVTVNKEAYIELTKAKLATQIADLEVLKNDVQTKLVNDGNAAFDAAGNFVLLAGAKALANDADYQSLQSTEAQIAALGSLRDNLEKTVTSIQKSSSSASKTAKTTSEKFKAAVDDIQYQLDMGLISDAEYWEQYSALQSKYLKKGSDEWQDAEVKKKKAQDDANEKLLKSNEDAYDELFDDLKEQYKNGEIDLRTFLSESERLRNSYLSKNTDKWKTSYENLFDDIKSIETDRLQRIKDDYDSALKDIQSAQEDMAKRLSETELVTSKTEDNRTTYSFADISDLQAQNDQIVTLTENLQKLKDAGISGSLLSEIAQMETEEAIAYSKYLVNLSENDEAWTAYMAAWDQKQESAKLAAETFYKSQYDALNTSLTTEINSLQADMGAAGIDLGNDIVAGIVQGIMAGSLNVEMAMQSVIQAAQAAAKEAAEIASPSKLFKREIGAQIPAGIAVGIEDGSGDVQSAIATVLNDMAKQAKVLKIDAVSAISNLTGSISTSTPLPTAAQGGAIGGSSTEDMLTMVNALLAGMRGLVPASAASAQSQQPSQLILDGREVGRAIYPYIIKEQERLGVKTT